MSSGLKVDIIAAAKDAGFDIARFTDAYLPNRAQAGLHDYLAKGHHGAMDWMQTTAERRASPRALWPQAKTVIMLGMTYGPRHDPLSALEDRQRAVLSVYAQGADYHDLVKKRLKRVARALVERTGAEVKVFVDTAPVMEKPLAVRAGIGWQGKHTNLVSRQFGSWLFLGSIFTTAEIAPDPPQEDHCGTCRDCLDICPTNAFPAPYRLDARRCISYLTIEHKGHIPHEFRAAMGNRIFGCDDCLAVCPWNKFARISREAKLEPRRGLERITLGELAALDGQGFAALFSGSCVKRTGLTRFLRNVLIAIGNSGDAALGEQAVKRLDDASPLVRAMAVRACRLLDEQEFFRLKGEYLPLEADAAVRAEWEHMD